MHSALVRYHGRKADQSENLGVDETNIEINLKEIWR
jgi:hypothetical protein